MKSKQKLAKAIAKPQSVLIEHLNKLGAKICRLEKERKELYMRLKLPPENVTNSDYRRKRYKYSEDPTLFLFERANRLSGRASELSNEIAQLKLRMIDKHET